MRVDEVLDGMVMACGCGAHSPSDLPLFAVDFSTLRSPSPQAMAQAKRLENVMIQGSIADRDASTVEETLGPLSHREQPSACAQMVIFFSRYVRGWAVEGGAVEARRCVPAPKRRRFGWGCA